MNIIVATETPPTPCDNLRDNALFQGGNMERSGMHPEVWVEDVRKRRIRYATSELPVATIFLNSKLV